MCVCMMGLWSVSAGHQSVRVERAGGAGDGAEAHRQQSCCGGETTAKSHGNRSVCFTQRGNRAVKTFKQVFCQQTSN